MTAGLLRKFSVTYLFLPNLLFALGWFRTSIAITIAIGLAYLLFSEWKRNGDNRNIGKQDLLVIVIASALGTFFSGVDGLSSQSMDWLAHHAKFYDLYKNDWPTYFPEVEQYACYYFGYYLVPALLSKLSGALLPGSLVVWTFAGYFLGISWLYILLDKNRLAVFLFFFLRGTGLLVLTVLKWFHITAVKPPTFTPSLRSVFEQGSFAPNQLIPALIASCILLDNVLQKKRLDEVFFILTLVIGWAIFPACTLLILYAFLFLFQQQYRTLRKDGIWHIAKTYLLPTAVFFPALAYYLSSANISSGFLLLDSPFQIPIVVGYFTGFLLDLLLVGLIIFKLNRRTDNLPQKLTKILITCLIILSVFRVGKYNDLFFRGSLPFCIMLYILLIRSVIHSQKLEIKKLPLLARIACSLLLLLVLTEITLNINLLRNNKIANALLGATPAYPFYPYDKYSDTYQALRYGYRDDEGAAQYLGKKGSFYELYLSRRHQ